MTSFSLSTPASTSISGRQPEQPQSLQKYEYDYEQSKKQQQGGRNDEGEKGEADTNRDSDDHPDQEEEQSDVYGAHKYLDELYLQMMFDAEPREMEDALGQKRNYTSDEDEKEETFVAEAAATTRCCDTTTSAKEFEFARPATEEAQTTRRRSHHRRRRREERRRRRKADRRDSNGKKMFEPSSTTATTMSRSGGSRRKLTEAQRRLPYVNLCDRDKSVQRAEEMIALACRNIFNYNDIDLLEWSEAVLLSLADHGVTNKFDKMTWGEALSVCENYGWTPKVGFAVQSISKTESLHNILRRNRVEKIQRKLLLPQPGGKSGDNNNNKDDDGSGDDDDADATCNCNLDENSTSLRCCDDDVSLIVRCPKHAAGAVRSTKIRKRKTADPTTTTIKRQRMSKENQQRLMMHYYDARSPMFHTRPYVNAVLLRCYGRGSAQRRSMIMARIPSPHPSLSVRSGEQSALAGSKIPLPEAIAKAAAMAASATSSTSNARSSSSAASATTPLFSADFTTSRGNVSNIFTNIAAKNLRKL